MSKTVELARHLETLHINNMYKSDFYWTWDKSDEEIDAVFTVADAMVTNLHLPYSTQLMMVAAFGGYETVMNAYKRSEEHTSELQSP